MKDGIDYDKLNLLNLESKDKDVGIITGVENVTTNNSISSEKNKQKQIIFILFMIVCCSM
jgi:hypothetical protein